MVIRMRIRMKINHDMMNKIIIYLYFSIILPLKLNQIYNKIAFNMKNKSLQIRILFHPTAIFYLFYNFIFSTTRPD